MEAVPRLHMLWFVLKTSPTGTSFANLKKYITELYQEDPEAYSKEVFALETLRNQALHPGKDKCAILKRYYCQLHSLQNRFPQLAERSLFTFTWKDLYQNNVNEFTDLRYELAAVLFNIAASHTQMGASVTRGDVDGMKLACTHFQCAAWAFGELRERYENVNGGGDFMTTELLVFMKQVSFAEAQECILEKSLIDNRKPNIVAKVTAQIVVYYGAALAALLTGGDDGPIAQVVDSSVFKLWKKYVRLKISYLSCILYLYQGQHAEEQQKMGERVTLYQAASEKLEEARKESKGLPDQKEINESLIFTADVVEGKLKNAKNDNEFIYHESVPELSSITAVQGANLVNGTRFSVTDPEVAGDDIFARLVPMKAHEASSLYSEEKAKLLRKYGSNIEEKDAELASFMSSLTLDNLNINEEKANKIPQGIVDRCAELNANKTAIPDLIAAMSHLAEICTDVETNLKDISAILSEEEVQENDFQKLTGVQRTPNPHITELTREFQKYTEAHARAGESNDTLRKAMELHVNNLKILSRPLHEIQQSVPKLSAELNTTELFKDVKLILNNANEMKAQRAQFLADLRIAVNDDDITAKVIAHGSDEGLQLLFDRELAKHERLTQLLDQNMLAQKNILQALTEAYAKAAPVLKTLADVKHKREAFFTSLAASYDVYEDLLDKSAKGLEFYKKLSGNVQKLLTRLKAARDVQSEERQQRLKNQTKIASNVAINTAKPFPPNIVPTTATSSTPKLRDYLKSKNTTACSIAAVGTSDTVSHNSISQNNPYVPLVRPNPLGSENPTQAVCSSGSFYASHPMNPSGSVPVAAPNEPPPPYSLQQQQYYDPNTAGYANPMYQQQQQNIAPPAYKLQASPNSQFANSNANNPNMTGVISNAANLGQHEMLSQQQQFLHMQQQQQLMMRQTSASTGMHAQQVTPPVATGVYGANQNNFVNQQQTALAARSHENRLNDTGTTRIYIRPRTVTSATFPKIIWEFYAATTTTTTAATGVSTEPTATSYSCNSNNPQAFNSLPVQFVGVSATDARGPAAVPQHESQMNTFQPPYSQVSTPNLSTPTSRHLCVATADNAQAATGGTVFSVQAPLAFNSYQQLAYSGVANSGAAAPESVGNLPQHPQPQPNYQIASGVVNPTSSEALAVAFANQKGVQITAPNSYPYSTTKHPGYSFNQQTGIYEYGSGYQQVNNKFYGQYTSSSAPQSATGTTDSENANKTNVATGFNSPVVSHTKSSAGSATPSSNAATSATESASNLSYYSTPYGYQSQGIASPYALQMQQQQQLQLQQALASAQHQQQQQKPKQTNYQQQLSTYMQSGGASIAPTQTTKSASEYSFGSKQGESASESDGAAPSDTKPGPDITKPASKRAKKPTNIDLLTDIDFSACDSSVPSPILPQPVLNPEIVASPRSSQVAIEVKQNSTTQEDEMVDEFEEVDLLYRFPDDEDDDGHFSELSGSDSEEDTDNMYLDKYDLDLREKEVARLYGSKIPPCCSNQCNEVIPKKKAVDFRTSFMNLDKESQDLIILAHLAAHRDDAMLRSKVGDRSRAMKKRYNQIYYFRSLPICRDMYFFLYTMGIKRYKNLIEHYDKNGVYPREHGMTNKINRTDALTTLEKKEIVSFICRFAETVAITLPGRQPNHRDYRLLKLPTTESKTSVYTRYINSVEPGGKIVKLRTFRTLWKKYCPYIVTMKPAYDLCELCRNLAKDAVNTVNVTEVEKEAALKVYADHLQSASTQREYYNDLRTLVIPDPNAMYPGIPEEDYLVISMDYAQNVSFPSGPQQIGTAYFKSGRKTAIFGITNDRQNVQHIFCIDESDSIGNGPNSVISMLDYYLREVHSTKKLVIFADNCVSQNKNNAMIRYLQHLVDTSRCESVELNFLLTGHTKFSPDRLFGVFKSKYAQTNVDCFMDVVDCVRKSSHNGFNVPVPIRLPNSSEPVVEWRKWDEYFSTKYKTLIEISKYHHFVFIAESPVQCKLFANSASIKENIHLSNNTSFDDKPIIIPSPGLSMKRQWYLYKEIRGLCFDDSKKDSVAPLPLVSGNGKEEEDSEEVDNPQEVEASDVKKKSKKNKGPVPSSSKEPIRKNRRLK